MTQILLTDRVSPRPRKRHTANFVATLCGCLLSLTSWAEPSLSVTGAALIAAPQLSRALGAPGVFSSAQDSVGSIDGDDIRVLVWNVHKGIDSNWIGDFRSMASDSDLVLLQEAHLHTGFADGLEQLPRWDMVDAWNLDGFPTGVLTASNATPLSVRALEQREPLLRTDKSALVTEYRLGGTRQTLLVANMHSINFTINTRAFRAQLVAVAELLQQHDGPVILSGDLNTWRGERRAIVDEIAASLKLTEVPFDGPRRQFGRFPLDHLFYRGLLLLDSEVPAVGSSDHNPLLVTFRNPGWYWRDSP